MRVVSLQSGSNGNCIYVEADGVRLLFDAGISGVRAETRLAAFGRNIRDVDALIVSHEHGDHVRSAGVYQRKFGLPIYVTEPTLAAARRFHRLGRLHDVRHFRSGEALTFGRVTVRTIPTPHDGVDAVAFVVEAEARCLGILTDLGHVFDELPEVIASLDAAILESNYDPEMLETGRYPESVKARIRGRGGHLSNQESAELLSARARGLRWTCLGHLSAENNSPELALQTHHQFLRGAVALHLATRYEPSSLLEL